MRYALLIMSNANGATLEIDDFLTQRSWQLDAAALYKRISVVTHGVANIAESKEVLKSPIIQLSKLSNDTFLLLLIAFIDFAASVFSLLISLNQAEFSGGALD